MQIQIKNRWSGAVLFECDYPLMYQADWQCVTRL